MTQSQRSIGAIGGRIDWADLETVPLVDGITARSMSGAEISVTEFDLESGAVVPEHSHPNDEYGYVVAGDLHLWWGSDDLVLTAGESFFVPRDVSHRAVAGSAGCRLVECYGPPRLPVAPASPRSSS